MTIAYNPLKKQDGSNNSALSTAPSYAITFDLPGKTIYAKGVEFKGTDTTYNVFKKHTSDSNGGYDGLVPVPDYNGNSKTRFLREDGTWIVPNRPISINGTSILNNNNTALDLVAGTNITLSPEKDSNNKYTGEVTITANAIGIKDLSGTSFSTYLKSSITYGYNSDETKKDNIVGDFGIFNMQTSSYTESEHFYFRQFRGQAEIDKLYTRLYYKRENENIKYTDWKEILKLGDYTTLAGYGITDAVKIVKKSANVSESCVGYTTADHNLQNGGLFTGLGADGLYGSQLLGNYVGTGLYYRGKNNGTWTAWKTVAFTDSNVASATKLKTARKIWGQNFDGTADVSGGMTGVTSIQNSSGLSIISNGLGFAPENAGDLKGALVIGGSVDYGLAIWGEGSGKCYLQSGRTDGKNAAYNLILQHLGGKVGIGTISPTEKLEVSGNIKATSFLGNLDWSYITNKPTSFTPVAHDHTRIINTDTTGRGIEGTLLPSKFEKGLTFNTIYSGLDKSWPINYGNVVTIRGNGDNLIVISWNANQTETNTNVAQEMYIRSKRDSAAGDKWSDWTRVITDRNYPEYCAPKSHTHASSQITALTGYSKATSAADLAATDTLNAALGKLEYKADTAYDWIISVTTEDTDKYINKWSEIVGFLDSVKEGTDITEEFVTRKTTQTITGAKTFNGTTATILTVDRDSDNPTYIAFKNKGTLKGYLGIDSSENPVYTDTNVNKYKILHAGNYTNYKHSYTNLTGSTIIANQAIVSNGTKDGWKLLTLGSGAFLDDYPMLNLGTLSDYVEYVLLLHPIAKRNSSDWIYYYSYGTIYTHRSNGLGPSSSITYNSIPKYGSSGPTLVYVSMMLQGRKYALWCTCTYNGLKYCGLKLYISTNHSADLTIKGRWNSDPVLVKYKKNQRTDSNGNITSEEIIYNEEIANSIVVEGDDIIINSTYGKFNGTFVTSGGTASQFVKGDGSLDSNTYAVHNTAVKNVTSLTHSTLGYAYNSGKNADTFWYTTGPVALFGTTNYKLALQLSADNDVLKFRRITAGSYENTNWRTLIHDGNFSNYFSDYFSDYLSNKSWNKVVPYVWESPTVYYYCYKIAQLNLSATVSGIAVIELLGIGDSNYANVASAKLKISRYYSKGEKTTDGKTTHTISRKYTIGLLSDSYKKCYFVAYLDSDGGVWIKCHKCEWTSSLQWRLISNGYNSNGGLITNIYDSTTAERIKTVPNNVKATARPNQFAEWSKKTVQTKSEGSAEWEETTDSESVELGGFNTPFGSSLTTWYNDTVYNILRNNDNSNIILNSCGGGLYLGYENTSSISLEKPTYAKYNITALGDIILKNSSGSAATPYLYFKRNNINDSYVDWRFGNNNNGKLILQYNYNDTNATTETWNDVFVTTRTISTFKSALEVTGSYLTLGNSNGSDLIFKRPSANYIWTDEPGGYFVIGVKDTGGTSSANASLLITKEFIQPGIRNNAVYLGNSSYRWANVFSVLGNFSGNVTAAGFVKSGSTDSHVLLGAGGHKALSDFMMKGDDLAAHTITITKSIKLTKDWQETGIVINDATFTEGAGTYAVQVDINAGEATGFWYSLFSGIASFQTSCTNGTEPDDEILLHHSSHGCSKQIYLKTKPTQGGLGYYNKLYIACNTACSTAVNITFKFKKLI